MTLINFLNLLFFAVNPLLYSFLLREGRSVIRRYVTGQFLVWAGYSFLGWLLFVLKLDKYYYLIPFLAFLGIGPYLWRIRKSTPTEWCLGIKEDLGAILIAIVTLGFFAMGVINYGNGMRVPVFSNSWDAATHYLFTTQIIDKGSLGVITIYPFGFHLNGAVTFVSLLSLVDRLDDPVFRVTFYSLWTIYVLISSTSMIYYGLIDRLKCKKNRVVRMVVLSLLVMILTADIFLSVFRFGFFSYLLALGFMGFLFYLFSKEKVNLVIETLALAGFSWSYFYLAPITLPMIILRAKKHPKPWLSGSLMLGAIGFPLLPFAYEFLTKINTYMEMVLTSPGGYQEFSLFYFGVLGFLALAGLYLTRMKRDDYQKMVMVTIVALVVYQGVIFLGQMMMSGKPDYSFFKPLVFLAYLLILILLSSLDRMMTRFDRKLLIIVPVISLLVVYHSDLAYLRKFLWEPKNEFHFLHPYLYNSAILFKEQYLKAEQTVAIVLFSSDYLWTHHLIGQKTTLSTAQTLYFEDKAIETLGTEIATHKDIDYAVFDPAFRTSFLCNEYLLQLTTQPKVVFFPERDNEKVRQDCANKQAENEIEDK